jgi:hypothetical protein
METPNTRQEDKAIMAISIGTGDCVASAIAWKSNHVQRQ